MTQSEKISKLKKCRACGSKNLHKWVDLGSQPIANNLVKNPLNFVDDTYPLAYVYCKDCELVQTAYLIDRDVFFKDYKYYSSTSEVFKNHFRILAEKEFNLDQVKKGDLIVDIGSNDGILLKPFKEKGARVLGVEPAQEVANFAAKNGIETISDYFDSETAEYIVNNFGKTRLITATNVFAHVDDLNEIMEAVDILLGDDGRFMIEVAYLPRMLEKGTFDLLYHEHTMAWHLHPLSRFFNSKGFYISEIEEIDVHGGSIRVYVKKTKSSITGELDRGLINERMFKSFPKRIEINKENILKVISDLNRKGKRIVGYGAPAKMSTMTNYFDITPKMISCIVDDSPPKQGLYSPGKHIKIVAYDRDFVNEFAQYIFIFAWNFAPSIMDKLKEEGYKGKFIIPFPNVKIV